MRLMGSQGEFISVPFLVEGLVMGLAGMCIPILLLLAGYRWGLELVAAGLSLSGGTVSLLPPAEVFPKPTAAASVILGLVTGVAGGWSVMGKLKK